MWLRESPTRPFTNRPVQPQKLARVLKFWLYDLKILYYLSSEQQKRWSGCADFFWFCITTRWFCLTTPSLQTCHYKPNKMHKLIYIAHDIYCTCKLMRWAVSQNIWFMKVWTRSSQRFWGTVEFISGEQRSKMWGTKASLGDKELRK